MASHRTAPRAQSPLPPPPSHRAPTPASAALGPVSPTSENRARSSSDSTPRAPTRPTLRDQSRATSPMPDTSLLTPTRNRRAGLALPRNVSSPIAGSIVSTASSSSTTFLPLHQMPSRSQSRADSSYPSSLTPLRDNAPSPAPQKSPQKSLRHYDSKYLARELDRLGFLPHLPSAAQFSLPHSHSHSHHVPLPHLSTPLASASSLSLSLTSPSPPQPPHSANAPNAPQDPWTALHVHVLPLFNGEPLRCPIEDLNVLVRNHLHAALTRSPSKVMQMMDGDLNDLVSRGMVTLRAKLTGLDGDRLLARLVEKWGFFYGQVLPYVEGVFLPFQTDQLLLSLRTAKRPAGDGDDEGNPAAPANRVDVRKLVLHAFRDHVIDDLYPRLLAFLKSGDFDKSAQWGPRFQQMLLVLISSSTQFQPAGSPTSAHLLLRAFSPSIRPYHGHYPYQSPSSLPSFSTTSLSRPRDRRGRIASKHYVGSFHWREGEDDEEEEEGDVEETPRGGGFVGAGDAPQMGLGVGGGWGLGSGSGEDGRVQPIHSGEEEDEEETQEDAGLRSATGSTFSATERGPGYGEIADFRRRL